ncbi:hypothetical protein [Spiroplasma endosymbiont of 'Nebria riversi']|uniref:hypothetical protein n=1 Tax=Spiroplasma endosymbiont of 'Nebria riversi' TaxID=2792084 RepID=UPI001C03C4D4|nr:hypothetical protein [Spiroplasma endosymbiont of 'Nebria riversi']
MAFLGYVCVWGYWMLAPYLNSSLSLQMLNVGNALSILIKLPHNQGNILFDAVIDSLNKNFNFVENSW